MQFFRFLTVGLLNTLVGLGFIYTGMWVFGLDYRVANAIGYGAGCAISFLINRSWTFNYEGSYWGSAARWVIVVGVCFLINLSVVIVLYEHEHLSGSLAQLGGVICYTAASFFGGRFFAFRKTRATVLQELR